MAKIMIVDDHAAVRELVDMILSKEGHQVLHAENGAQALALIATEQPDLILLDIMMPGNYDGLAVLEQLKVQQSLYQSPVLVLSACDQKKQRELAGSLGAADYLLKPFKIDSLLSAVKSHLEGQIKVEKNTYQQLVT